MTRKNWLRTGTYGTLGVIVAIFLAHPYTRQTAFGPRIKGMPFAYWQDRCREAALPTVQEQSFTARILRFLHSNGGAGIEATAEMLPVVLSLRDDPNERVRAHVAWILRRYPDSDDARAVMSDCLDDPSPMVRSTAAHAFGAMEPPQPVAVPKLRARLDDDDTTCRLRAACAIFQITRQPDKRISVVLQDALQSVDDAYQRDAIHSLCQLGERYPEFLELVRSLAASNPKLAGTCASCLMEVGPSGIPVLIDLLGTQDRNARQTAAYRLGFFGALGLLGARKTDVIAALVLRRDDADRFVREQAAIALSQIDPQRFSRPNVLPGGAAARKR